MTTTITGFGPFEAQHAPCLIFNTFACSLIPTCLVVGSVSFKNRAVWPVQVPVSVCGDVRPKPHCIAIWINHPLLELWAFSAPCLGLSYGLLHHQVKDGAHLMTLCLNLVIAVQISTRALTQFRFADHRKLDHSVYQCCFLLLMLISSQPYSVTEGWECSADQMFGARPCFDWSNDVCWLLLGYELVKNDERDCTLNFSRSINDLFWWI